jgi:group I intron endonuclease
VDREAVTSIHSKNFKGVLTMDIYTQTMAYVIYIATNLVNDQSYIGFTENLKERINQHSEKSYIKSDRAYHHYFHRAIRKYKLETFEWKILYQSNDKEFTHKIMERYFIKLLKTHYIDGYGYNMTYGGEGTHGLNHSKETREKMSKSRIGTKPSDETRKKQSEWQLGRKLPESTREKMSAASKGKPKSEGAILKRSKTYLITFPDGHQEEIINMCKFCREHGLSSSHMFAIASGNRKSHKGFKCSEIS